MLYELLFEVKLHKLLFFAEKCKNTKTKQLDFAICNKIFASANLIFVWEQTYKNNVFFCMCFNVVYNV